MANKSQIIISGDHLDYLPQFKSLFGNLSDFPNFSRDHQTVLVLSPKTHKIGKFIFETSLSKGKVNKYRGYGFNTNLFIKLTK